uniref:Uncharacterized protein n=1 Tax=Arundo donax TaxID=35708 RepID=A0A0A9E050_ARUDO
MRMILLQYVLSLQVVMITMMMIQMCWSTAVQEVIARTVKRGTTRSLRGVTLLSRGACPERMLSG